MDNPESVLQYGTRKVFKGFHIPIDYQARLLLILLIVKKKKRKEKKRKEKKFCRIVNFAVLADHRIRLKESEKRDKYQHFARELKKLWNIKVTVIPIVIVALGRDTKGLVLELENLEIRKRRH